MKDVKICDQKKQSTGYTACVPIKFPTDELFNIPQDLLMKAVKAERLIGKLDGITQTLPDIDFFLKMFSYKDAASSSQIEGTQATMPDALQLSSNIGGDQTDASDIVYYIKALNYGVERLEEFPISLRFIQEIHGKLMKGARSSRFSDPGNFRKSQNWIGGTSLENASFVPVPPDQMIQSLADLENFMYDEGSIFPLILIGYVHAQFETIHPFLDGNGRVGRLLITFLLMKKNLLEKPALFLSAYFKKHQRLYYRRLNGYHNGEVFKWLDFFLDGIIETAEESIKTSEQIRFIRDEDMEKIHKLAKRESESGMKVLKHLFEDPIVTTRSIMDATGFTRAGAQGVIDRFMKLEILIEKPKETNYDVKYSYKRYLSAFID